MSQSSLNLKSFCKQNKVKLPKEPYMLRSYALNKIRSEILKFLREKVDKGGGSITINIPMDNTEGHLFFENGKYFFSSEKLGKHELDDLSVGFLGEQLYYSIQKGASLGRPEQYERAFDGMEGLIEDWMHVIISNKEKRIVLNTSVPLQYSGDGYAPGKMVPGTITAVYEKEGEFYVCVDGRDDIYWFDLNIETMVSLGDELYNEFIAQVSPSTIEEALTLIAVEVKNKYVRCNLASYKKTPVSVLDILAKDTDEEVRKTAAKVKASRKAGFDLHPRPVNPDIPNIPVEELAKMAYDSDDKKREIAAENPNTPADCLVKLSKDIMWNVIQKVALNPSTPLEVLMAFANTADKYITLVVDNPQFPLSKILELAGVACFYPKVYPTSAIIRSLLGRIDSK